MIGVLLTTLALLTTPAKVADEAPAAVKKPHKGYFSAKSSSVDGELLFGVEALGSEPLGSGYDAFTMWSKNSGPPRQVTVTIEAELNPAETRLQRHLRLPTGEQRVSLLLPVLAPDRGRRPLRVSVVGPGVALSDSTYVSSRNDYVIGGGPGFELDKEDRKKADGVQLDLTRLPADWRALLGYDQLVLTAAQRQALPAAQAQALRTWVALGGILHISRPGPLKVEAFGLGRVIRAERPHLLGAAAPSCAEHRRRSDPVGRSQACAKPLVASYRLASPMGVVALFLTVFFLVVGPLNLAWSWRRRSRLLWTTPAISLAAAALLFGAVLFKDGVGGDGHRQLLRILPGEDLELWVQEQASKNGLLVGGGGAPELPSDAALELLFNAGVYTEDQQESSTRGLSLRREDGARKGSWFLSRAVQAHRVTRAARSRSYLDRQGDTLRSNLDVPLKRVWLWERQEGLLRWWLATGLQPGGEAKLTPVTGSEPGPEGLERLPVADTGVTFEREDPTEGGFIRRAIKTATDRWPIGFVAEGPQGGAIPSRSDIRWQEAPVVLLGVPRGAQ